MTVLAARRSAQVGQARAASTALVAGCAVCAAAPAGHHADIANSPGWASICTRCAVLICPTELEPLSASSAKGMPRRRRCAGRVGCGLTCEL